MRQSRRSQSRHGAHVTKKAFMAGLLNLLVSCSSSNDSDQQNAAVDANASQPDSRRDSGPFEASDAIAADALTPSSPCGDLGAEGFIPIAGPPDPDDPGADLYREANECLREVIRTLCGHEVTEPVVYFCEETSFAEVEACAASILDADPAAACGNGTPGPMALSECGPALDGTRGTCGRTHACDPLTCPGDPTGTVSRCCTLEQECGFVYGGIWKPSCNGGSPPVVQQGEMDATAD
jgi:hypothetical protein